MSQKLQNQTPKRQEMLKFVPDTWPSYVLVVQPLIAVTLQSSQRQRKMSHLQPAQPRAHQGWTKNLAGRHGAAVRGKNCLTQCKDTVGSIKP